MSYPAKTERNQALFRDYLGGMHRVQVAAKYGLTTAGLDSLLVRHSVTLPQGERWRRLHEAGLKAPRVGRGSIWPDCPPHLRSEYQRLRKQYGYRAAEARQMLEASL